MSVPSTFVRNYRPLLLSCIIAFYFVCLILVNLFRVDFVLVGVFTELLTIPALLALVLYLGYNVWQGFRAEPGQRRVHWMAVAVLLGCVGLLGWMSF